MDEGSPRTVTESTRDDAAKKPALACFACGYSLQGLPVDGMCPECGEAIARSVEAARGFTKRELASVACKLFGLWMFLSAGARLLQLTGYLLYDLQNTSGGYWDTVIWFVSGVVVPALLGGALWWRANWLAGLMVRRDGVASVGPLDRRDLMHIALGVLGVYLALTGLEYAIGAVAGSNYGPWSDVQYQSCAWGSFRRLSGRCLASPSCLGRVVCHV